MKTGFKKVTARDIEYYASTYADNPNRLVRSASKVVGIFNGNSPSQFSKNEKNYQNIISELEKANTNDSIAIANEMKKCPI